MSRDQAERHRSCRRAIEKTITHTMNLFTHIINVHVVLHIARATIVCVAVQSLLDVYMLFVPRQKASQRIK